MSETRLWCSRVLRAIQLDASVFEEVEHDHSAGPGAALVVLLAATCAGAGNLLATALLGGRTFAWSSLLIAVACFLLAWLTWSFVMMAIGTSCFGGVADMGEMQRALGFAAAPGLLLVLPGIGAIVGIPWALAAMVLAVRQALDFSTRRAVQTVALGSVVMLLVVLPAGCWVRRVTPVALGSPPASFMATTLEAWDDPAG